MLTVKGIIIRVTDYKEKDRLLTLAAFNKGLLTVNAKGARGEKARLKCYSNLLTFGEFQLTEAKNRYILCGVDCEENFFNLWTDPARYSAGILCLELFEKVARENDDINEELLRLLKALRDINYSPSYPLVFAARFMTQIMTANGVDYKEIAFYDEDVYRLVERIAKETEIPDSEEIYVKKGIQFLGILLKNALNIHLRVISEILKTL